MNPLQPLEIGDVVQLGPNTPNQMFAFCMMTVTDPKSWGAQGYVQALGDHGKRGGQAYYRAKFEDMEFVGRCTWQIENAEGEDEVTA